VLKFGGTSVAGRQQWQAIGALVAERRRAGHRVLVVCSAVAGVTNLLERLQPGDPAGLEQLLQRHRTLADELQVEATDLIHEAGLQLQAALSALAAGPHPRWRAQLMACGEWLSTQIGARYLAGEHDARWVDACAALAVNPEPEPDSLRAWQAAQCAAGFDQALQQRWQALAPVLVTQGFVAAAPGGGVALLGRGGSDTSAALLGSRLGAAHVEIWTDVAGLYSADPRQHQDAQLISRLAYAEALEMAAGGARVIHGRSIRAAAEGGTAVWIRDLASPASPGTLIDADGDGSGESIRAVIHQPGMLVLLLENLDTRQQVGFLAGVFEAISRRGVSVDLVATSETTTTLAIHRQANLLDDTAINELVTALQCLCRVQLFSECSCVNLVGRGARLALARLGCTQAFFREQRLLMASLSANDLSLSLLVESAGATQLAQLLHRQFIGPAAAGEPGR
jgi:diaminopimelate decarboxylase/aspartate kinase